MREREGLGSLCSPDVFPAMGLLRTIVRSYSKILLREISCDLFLRGIFKDKMDFERQDVEKNGGGDIAGMGLG